MINGISHIGIGVDDVDDSLKFYQGFLGFRNVVFDYEGLLPGMDRVAGKTGLKARIIMLASDKVSPVASGMIKLVQVLNAKPHRPKVEFEWGNIGIAEVCLSVHNIEAVYKLATVEKGFKAVLAPSYYKISGEEFKVCYFRGPSGVLIELIEWQMYRGFGGTPAIEAVNHVAIGVSNMEKSVKFYSGILGFKTEIFDYAGDMAIAAPMLPSPTPDMKMKMISNSYKPAYLEVFQHLPPYRPPITAAHWGDIGHMEFAIEVSNLDRTYDQLLEKGVKFLCPPEKMDFPPSGEWKYAYVVEPDGLIVSLVEH